jgi:hypothetical protein
MTSVPYENEKGKVWSKKEEQMNTHYTRRTMKVLAIIPTSAIDIARYISCACGRKVKYERKTTIMPVVGLTLYLIVALVGAAPGDPFSGAAPNFDSAPEEKEAHMG